MGNFFVAQGWVTLKWMVWSGPKLKLSEILWQSSLPASMTKIQSKMKLLSSGQHFPHYKSMGAFGCHGNQSFNPICPKTLCYLSPTQVKLHVKFEDWPTGHSDIQVWKCGQQRRCRQTDGRPLVHYKLPLWTFSSGELKISFFLIQLIINKPRGNDECSFSFKKFKLWLRYTESSQNL